MRKFADEERIGDVVQALALARSHSPVKAKQYEERIRFAADRVDELRRPLDGLLVRADRIRVALQILDQRMQQADEFLDLIASDIIAQRVA